ncbi:MAG: nuclear transport factor 2 family protein [Comamonas sp.]
MKVAFPPLPGRRLATAALLLLGLAGCAALQPATPEEAVTARAEQRWKALIAHDWDAAYQFLTPAFRATMNSERWAYRFVGVPKWLEAPVQSAKCEDDKCTVVVRIVVDYPTKANTKTLHTDVTETWLREDGQWYKYEPM